MVGTQRVKIHVDADRSEARPGDSVYYTVTIRNTSTTTLSGIQATYAFAPGQLTVLEADGVVYADRVQWTLDNLQADQRRALRFRAQVNADLTHGEVVRTTAIATVPNSNPVTAGFDLRIIQVLPATGLGDGVSPLENTRRFLTPFGGSEGHSAIPAILWTAMIVMGVAVGGKVGKRFW